MATAAQAPSTLCLASPHAQIRTCNLCRQRRVKCDRKIPQCSNCLRSGVHCVYPPGRGRAPKRLRRDVVPRLSERLSRLEDIINQFGASSQENQQAERVSDVQEESNTHSFDEDFSRLKVEESKSYYVNNALWVTLTNEVEELRDLLFEPANEDAGCQPMPSLLSPSHSSSTATSSPSRLDLNAVIFSYRAISLSLRHLHPSLAHAITLFAAFTDNVAPLVRIFHMPTLTRVYWDAIASLESLDKQTETLLFAIHYSAVISLTREQCLAILGEAREAALERYRFAVEQAFVRGNLLNTQSIMMLQAAVLFLSALPNEDDSRATWSLTSLVYHIARTMGLHRDGLTFGLKPFETELRRRLWWQICIIDSRSSEYHCNEPIARAFVSDTRPPLHINDADLSSEMVEPPAERWDCATDMTLTLVRCEAIQAGWKLGHIKPKQPGSQGNGNAPATSDKREPFKERRSLIQNLEARLRDKYLSICDSSVPLQLLSSVVARIVLARFWLVTQYSAGSHEKEADDEDENNISPGVSNGIDHLESSMRNELFQTSIGILEASGMLLTNKDITQWVWYSKTHIQWGAMAFVLSELCTRPHSPECDHAWECVNTVYDGWKISRSQGDESCLALWRPIRRLMAKARYVREIQQLDLGQPAQTGLGAQQFGLSRNPPAELPSHYPPTARTSTWYIPFQHEISTAPTPETSAPYSMEPSNALRRVLGTEALDQFMDPSLDLAWVDDNGSTPLPFVNNELGLSPRLP